MNPELIAIKRRLTSVEQTLGAFCYVDRYEFGKTVRHMTQKLAFYGSEPIMQPNAPTTPSGGGTSASDAVDISARVAIGQIKTALHNLGLTS